MGLVMLVWYGTVEFNVPLDTLLVISETISQVTCPNNSVIPLKDDG